ncbi:MAG: substrate-binding domain-containing protein [Eubacterium sp.]|nr:substrate-binding domain-containing protein [Eubacterium sp.]
MSNRKTIGFLVGGIMDEFIVQLCKGMTEEAEKFDLNLVVIPIKYINREMKDIPDLFEYQYQTNVENINSENIDVLIVAADCIGCLTTEENVLRFMDKLREKNIPIILAASKITGYPGVVFDNKAGIMDGMTYLVEELGLKNICMLKSIDHNADVSERYEAFLEMMEYYKLEVKPNSVITTELSRYCRDDCKKILDLNPDAEAIICVDDAIATTLYSVMEDRGLTPGKEIKVMGFDNSINASMMTPSLTTVEADAKTIAKQAFSMARLSLDGWKPGNKTVPTRFILRDSFGGFLEKDSIDQTILDKANIDKFFHRIFFKFENTSKQEDFPIFITFKTVMNIIIDYINDDIYSLERVGLIKKKISEFFRLGALEYTDLTVLLAFIDKIKSAAISRHDDPVRQCQAAETFSAILEEIMLTMKGLFVVYQDNVRSSLSSIKTLVDDTLNIEHGDDSTYCDILKNISTFGVKNAYIYIYDTPVVHNQDEEFKIPDKILIKAAMNNGDIVSVPKQEQELSVNELYENKFISDEKHSLVLMPLYFRNTLYGSILYDLTELSYRGGDYVANQYSTAARIINLLNRCN